MRGNDGLAWCASFGLITTSGAGIYAVKPQGLHLGPRLRGGDGDASSAYTVGLMFWLSRKRFVGSYRFLRVTSRS